MMKHAKIETYEPKKRFFEKVATVAKPSIKIFCVLVIITLTVFATKYFLEKDGVNNLTNEDSSQITGNALYSQNTANTNTANNPRIIKNAGVAPIKNKDLATSQNIVDYSTLASDLERSEFVKDLPNDAVLRLQFYDFSSGTRNWGKSYNLRKDSVIEGDEDGDIQIIMHSKYVDDFKTKGACDVLSEANNNGDFGADTSLSESALIWKYKSMIKYRDCLGL